MYSGETRLPGFPHQPALSNLCRTPDKAESELEALKVGKKWDACPGNEQGNDELRRRTRQDPGSGRRLV